MCQIALDSNIEQEAVAAFLNGVHQDAFAATVKDGLRNKQIGCCSACRVAGYGTGNCHMHNERGGRSIAAVDMVLA